MATSPVAIPSTPRGWSGHFTIHSAAVKSRTPYTARRKLLDWVSLLSDPRAHRSAGVASDMIECATPAARLKASGTVPVDGAHERHRLGGCEVERRWAQERAVSRV